MLSRKERNSCLSEEDIAVRFLQFLTMLAAALVFAACGGGTPAGTTSRASSPTGTPAAAGTQAAPGGANPGADQVSCNDGVVGSAVTIIDNAFQPTTIAADADDTVNWTNTGRVSHTVTFDNGKDCGTLASGNTLTVLFNSPGTYAYHCTIHPSMKATVTVS